MTNRYESRLDIKHPINKWQKAHQNIHRKDGYRPPLAPKLSL